MHESAIPNQLSYTLVKNVTAQNTNVSRTWTTRMLNQHVTSCKCSHAILVELTCFVRCFRSSFLIWKSVITFIFLTHLNMRCCIFLTTREAAWCIISAMCMSEAWTKVRSSYLHMRHISILHTYGSRSYMKVIGQGHRSQKGRNFDQQ